MNEVGMKNGAEMAVSKTAVCEYSGVRETGEWGSGSNEEGNLSDGGELQGGDGM